MADTDIQIFSQNVNGLGDPTKRLAVFTKLKKKGQGIFFLQETHSTEITESKWREQWGNKNIYFSHGSSNSKGVVIMFSNEFIPKVVKELKDIEGRFIILDIEHDNQTLTIANVYAPTRNKEIEQITVFKSFCETIVQFKMENTIIGGDFNLYLNPKLDKLDSMPDTNDNPSYRDNVKSFIETENLIDIWRTLNPFARFFTWHRSQQKSRLDYFFTSDHLLNNISQVDILPGIHSDHSLLKISFMNNTTNKFGKGFWKFNSSLLHDLEYVKNIKEIIIKCGLKYQHLHDKPLIWEFIKFEIRNYTVPYCIQKKKEQNSLETVLNKRYSQLHNKVLSNTADQNETEEFNNVKSELEVIERYKARGAMLRSKCRWVEEGEQNSSYFLRLEKHNFCNKHITQLNVNDSIITEQSEILKAEKQFYEKPYSSQILPDSETSEKHAKHFTDSTHIPKISEEFKEMCDSVLMESEVLNSLKNLKNNKSPGSDGLTAEFFKFFWIDIKQYLIESIQHALEHGELSMEQKRGIITLIPKKEKNRLFLKNWRPISLLNVDYKIIAKSLSNRICKVLPHVIDEDQTGYIKGRFIGCNIRMIEDAMIFTENNNLPGILLNIDFEKAFDSVNWNFIDQALTAFNFGPKFRSFIKTLYCNITSAVINNGEISEWFYPKRGVRQGCPISPYLFILVVELLAINIRENKNVKGIKIGETELKLCQLADDITCLVQDLDSVREVLEIFKTFQCCSGLKINIDKTKAIYIGTYKKRKDTPFGLDWSEECAYTLGITLSGHEVDHYELNFRKRIFNMGNLLRSWKCRKLSLKGKVTVINSLAISPLLYLASCIHVPDRVTKEVKAIIVDFLWDGKPTKLAYNVMIQQIEKGGLKLVDFESKVKTLKAAWVQRMTNNISQRWKAAPAAFYNTNSLHEYFKYNQSAIKLEPKFYQDIHNVWSELTQIDVNSVTQAIVKSQTIWKNRYITIQKKPFIWKDWLEHGIVTIDNILDENGNFLSHSEINDKYCIQSNFLNVLQLRQSIPSQWRSVLLHRTNVDIKTFNATNEIIVHINGKIYPLEEVSCNMFYIKLVEYKGREPTCIRKWKEDYPKFNDAEVTLWSDIFKTPYKTTIETQLQSFQYQVIHRLITCKKRLFDLKIKDSPKCEFCNDIDTIVHFFVYCPKIEAFWKSFFLWWNKVDDLKISPNCEHLEESILFGFQIEGGIFDVLNYCILVAKFYIYKQRLFTENNIDLYTFLVQLKYRLRILYNICKHSNTLDKFEKYQSLYEQL